jgi:hypothetical protein
MDCPDGTKFFSSSPLPRPIPSVDAARVRDTREKNKKTRDESAEKSPKEMKLTRLRSGEREEVNRNEMLKRGKVPGNTFLPFGSHPPHRRRKKNCHWHSLSRFLSCVFWFFEEEMKECSIFSRFLILGNLFRWVLRFFFCFSRFCCFVISLRSISRSVVSPLCVNW